MRTSTMQRMRAVLPATTQQAAQRLGIGVVQSCTVMAYLLKHRYVEQNGRDLTDKGSLIPIYQMTDKPLPD
jgi:hypothetical protein